MRLHNEAQQAHICWWWEMKEIKNKTYEWWWWRRWRWIRRHFAHRKSIELIAERIKIFWSCTERMQRSEFGFGLRDTKGDRNKTRIYRKYVVKTFKKLFLSINTSNKRAPFNSTCGRTLRFIFLIYLCSPFFFRRRRHHRRCCYCPFFVLHLANQSCITRWHSYTLVFISVSFDFFIYTKCPFLDHWPYTITRTDHSE